MKYIKYFTIVVVLVCLVTADNRDDDHDHPELRSAT